MQMTPSSAVFQITLVGYPHSQLRITLAGKACLGQLIPAVIRDTMSRFYM